MFSSNTFPTRIVDELEELGELKGVIEEAERTGCPQIDLNLHLKDGWDSCGKFYEQDIAFKCSLVTGIHCTTLLI